MARSKTDRDNPILPLLIIRGVTRVTCADLADASSIYQKERDASGKGASEFPDGRVGKFRISYNGRVWHGERLVQEATK